MSAKKPFHAHVKTEKNAEKNKHEILLSSKNVDETKEKLKRASNTEKAAESKSFVVENGEESKTLRASRPTDRTLFVSDSLDTSGDNPSTTAESQSIPAPKIKRFKRKRILAGIMGFVGGLLTVSWLGIVAGYVSEYIGWDEILNLQPHIMGGFLAGVLAPVAFIWFIVHLFQRGSELEVYSARLRDEMHNMMFPSEDARKTLQKDMQTMAQQAAELSHFSNHILKSIHSARHDLTQDMTAIEKLSSQSEKRFNDLVKSLSERSEKLSALTRDIEVRTGNIEKSSLQGVQNWDEAAQDIIERAKDIESAIEQGVVKISTAGQKAADQTDTVRHNIVASFEAIENKAGQMETRLSGLNGAMSDNHKEMTLMTDLFAADTKRLSDLLEGQLIGLQDLEGLSQKSMTIMQQVMEKDAKQHETLSETLQDRLIELSTIVDMAQEKTAHVEETLKTQSQAVIKEFDAAQDQWLTRIDKAAQALQERESKIEVTLDQITDKVSLDIKSAADRLAAKHDDVARELDSRSQALMKMVESSKVDVDRAEDILFDRFDKTKRSVLENMDAVTGAIADKQNEIMLKVGSQSEALVQSVNNAREEIAKAEAGLFERFEETSEKIMSGVDHARRSLDDKQTEIAASLSERSEALKITVEEAKNDIRRAEEALYKRHESIHTDFKNTYDRLSATVHDAKMMVQDMDQSLAKEQGRLHATVEKFKDDQALLKTLLKGHSESVEAIENSARQTLDLSREMLVEDIKTQEAFMNNLQNKLASLKDVSINIDTQTAEANEAINKLGSAQDLLVKQSELLTRVTKQAEDDLSHFEEALHVKQQQTKKQASGIIEDLSAIDASFDTRLPHLLEQSLTVKKELEGVSDALEKNSLLLDQKLKAQAAKIENLSRYSVDEMTDSISSLAETLVQIGGMVEGVQDSLEKSTQNFTHKAKQLTSVSKEASVAADQAASVFSKQTETMLKAAHQTSDNVHKLQKTQQNMRQDVFMNAAKFIIESLNSLAVDLTRAIDGGIHERMWKAYKDRDLGIFTSYLVSIEEELPMEDYQRKFIKESEFRSYVLSFIGQYEDMITQAVKVDHGALLATTFGTSDIGKLYRMLCKVADTAPLTQMEEIAAA